MAGKETGAVEVVLTWEYTYLPASAKVIRKYPEVGVSVSSNILMNIFAKIFVENDSREFFVRWMLKHRKVNIDAR